MNIKPIYQLKSWIKTKDSRKKNKKRKLFLKPCIVFLRVESLDEIKIFLTKSKGACLLNPDHSKRKVLTPKKMLQRLPTALAQLKAGNNSESLLNEIRQIVYSLCHSKQITKKVEIKSINV